MIKCDGIDKKKNEKCESPAKYIVKIDNKTHSRCGRHSRNMNKELIENNEKKKREIKSKVLKIDKNEDNKSKELNNKEEENNIQEVYYQKNNKDKKIETLFVKIDELCNLLNEKI
jgi:hypothetical protein